MQVNLLLFGIFREWLGADALSVELATPATVADLLRQLEPRLAAATPGAVELLGRSAVGINAEFAPANRLLSDGDEVALLPPVSGGSPAADEPAAAVVTALVRESIDAAALVACAKHGSDGAVLVFDGIVRDNTKGRRTLWLDYEAYVPMAARQMEELAREALTRFSVRHVTLVHRLGRLEIGETSVLIVVASAHRAAAFEACRWLIDTLKTQVPIWKRETFADGAVWAAGEPFPPHIAIDPEGGHER